MDKIKLLGVASAALAFLGVVPPAYSATFSDSTFSVPDSTDADVRGINDKGQIVGFSGTFPGFLYSGGAYTTLTGPPASIDTYATGINNRGEIVGFQFGNPAMAFYTAVGPTQPSAFQAALEPEPSVFNDRGQIVGFYETFGAGQFVANSFLYSGGIYTTLSGPPGSTYTYVSGINNSGQIVGYCIIGGNVHGFLYSGGTYTIISGGKGNDRSYVMIWNYWHLAVSIHAEGAMSRT